MHNAYHPLFQCSYIALDENTVNRTYIYIWSTTKKTYVKLQKVISACIHLHNYVYGRSAANMVLIYFTPYVITKQLDNVLYNNKFSLSIYYHVGYVKQLVFSTTFTDYSARNFLLLLGIWKPQDILDVEIIMCTILVKRSMVFHLTKYFHWPNI